MALETWPFLFEFQRRRGNVGYVTTSSRQGQKQNTFLFLAFHCPLLSGLRCCLCCKVLQSAASRWVPLFPRERKKKKVRKPSAFTQSSVLHRITAVSLFRKSLFFPMSKWFWLLTCSLLSWDHVASTEATASITEQLFEIKNKSSFQEVGKNWKIRYDRQKRSPSAEQGSFDPTTILLINFKIVLSLPRAAKMTLNGGEAKNEAHRTAWALFQSCWRGKMTKDQEKKKKKWFKSLMRCVSSKVVESIFSA